MNKLPRWLLASSATLLASSAIHDKFFRQKNYIATYVHKYDQDKNQLYVKFSKRGMFSWKTYEECENRHNHQLHSAWTLKKISCIDN